MMKTNPVSFAGKQKFDNYDAKQAAKVAAYAVSGESGKAKEAFNEFAADKKDDKTRQTIVSAVTLGSILFAAVKSGRAFSGKATKALTWIGDNIIDIFSKIFKKDLVKGGAIKGLLDTDIAKAADDISTKGVAKGAEKVLSGEDIAAKLKGSAKKVLKTLFPSEEKYTEVTNVIKKYLDKLGIKKYGDVAEIGVAAGIGAVVDDPINAILNKADNAHDAEKNDWE